jgi:riboflavin kinase/FMN adenylyltransferase
MRVFHGIHSISVIKRPIATIGIFDGVHLAHQAIIDRLKSTAYEMSGESVIITMWPHPRLVLKQGSEIKLLSTLEEKIERLEESGIENLVILPFKNLSKIFSLTG